MEEVAADTRRLLVTGGAAVIRWALLRSAPRNLWLKRMLKRQLPIVAAFALANKMARCILAMLTGGEHYHDPAVVHA
ncbi:hypothetical protein [Paracoccus chinensis]|uniref:Transposase n=1 Tax=Paracoccus chinensis TaxID=525640 RepID=A0A1G9LQB4_9RHOB|nr:hypothetical protein [Paracoccus chinensis]SDL64118.1 hypothetical protein SAMN04487971_11613 [Paracoccus chinensis]